MLLASGALFAHSALADDATTKNGAATTTVVVVGQRAALESAAMRKKNSDEIVDSIVADDIGKLPDKSVTEVLQRVVGVTIDRTMNLPDKLQGVGDAINHFAAEGTGVTVRGGRVSMLWLPSSHEAHRLWKKTPPRPLPTRGRG